MNRSNTKPEFQGECFVVLCWLNVSEIGQLTFKTTNPYTTSRQSVVLYQQTWAVVKIALLFHYTGWCIGIPRSWILIIPNILGSIIPYNHQPTRVFEHCSHGFSPSVSHPVLRRIIATSAMRWLGTRPIPCWRRCSEICAPRSMPRTGRHT